jgi:hypothetical protein
MWLQKLPTKTCKVTKNMLCQSSPNDKKHNMNDCCHNLVCVTHKCQIITIIMNCKVKEGNPGRLNGTCNQALHVKMHTSEGHCMALYLAHWAPHARTVLYQTKRKPLSVNNTNHSLIINYYHQSFAHMQVCWIGGQKLCISVNTEDKKLSKGAKNVNNISSVTTEHR